MKSYTFTIPGPPVGKGRPRAFMKAGMKYPMMHTDTKTRNFEERVINCATDAGVKPLERVRVDIVCFLPVRVTVRKTMADKVHEPLKRPDLDNVAKAVCDALNKIAYKDDKHILELTVKFSFLQVNEVPFTWVYIREVQWQGMIQSMERPDE